MFKMSYAGPLEMLGSGRTTSAYMSRRSVVKIGGQRIRNVMLSDYLDSTLETGVDDGQETRLSVGWIMFFRWLLAVRHDGETLRESVFLFLAGTLTHLVVVFIVAVVAALVVSGVSEGLATVVGVGLFLFGLATAVMNVKAWLVPTF